MKTGVVKGVYRGVECWHLRPRPRAGGGQGLGDGGFSCMLLRRGAEVWNKEDFY